MSIAVSQQEVQVDITKQEKEVESLKQVMTVQRLNVSVCAQDLVDYCLSNAQFDGLVTKIPSSKNPFRERDTRCELL